jgi:hypothetical protein
MKKLITIALVCLGVVALAATPALAGNGNGPAPKATGDIWFTNPYADNATAHFAFNAQESATAKGNVSYEDPKGSYAAKVTDVHVDAATNSAEFSAVVTSTTYPGIPVGTQATWKVYDVSDPGVGSDYHVGVASNGWETPHLVITAGNIQIHS